MEDIMENKRLKRQLDEEEESCKEDRISNLPEPILHHILSFLPTKEVVATSILATLRRYLWRSIQTLYFDYNSEGEIMAFFSFVSRVLRCRDASDMIKFRLHCLGIVDRPYFDMWISTLVSNNVQELSVDVSRFIDPYVLPQRLLTCQTLRCLKIATRSVISFSSSACFPVIKVLHFGSVRFSVENSRKLCLDLPLVEELVIYQCHWQDINVVDISAPTLQILIIDDGYGRSSLDCELKIHAGKHMRSLQLALASFSVKFSLCGVSSLVDAFIEVDPGLTYALFMGMLLRDICIERCLTLGSHSIQCLSDLYASDTMPDLSFLINLKLLLDSRSKMRVRQLIDLLSNVPTIQSLSFPRGLHSLDFKAHGRLIGKTPPQFLSQLKQIDIREFRGTQNELWFVRLLLKSALLLEKISFRLIRNMVRSAKGESAREQLRMLAESSNCSIEMHDV